MKNNESLLSTLNTGIFLPKLNTLLVLRPVERHSRTALVRTKCVPHHCDWVHRALIANVLRFDPDDPIVIVFRSVLVLRPHCLILELDLGLGVEDDMQIGSTMSWHLLGIKPSD